MENKTGKYIKYAIGEIALVVIGILIALWINTKNQERIKQEKIDTILVQIQNDLLFDLERSQWLIRNYIGKDSIADILIGGNLTSKDIKEFAPSGENSIDAVTKWASPFNIQSNGYKQLMNILDGLPNKYDNLINVLNNNFTYRKTRFEHFNRNTEDIIIQYQHYLANNKNWMALDQYNAKISDAQIEYTLNDPKFKNHITLLFNSVGKTFDHYMHYRKGLMSTYIKINELLGESARPIPDRIRTTSVADKDKAKADRFIGTYKLISGPENFEMGKKIEVYKEGKDLYLKLANEVEHEEEPLLFLDTKKNWFVFSYSEILQFEYKGNNTLYIVHRDQGQTHWVKEVNE